MKKSFRNACSAKGYQYVQDRKLLTLPSKITLACYLGPFTEELGITTLIKKRLTGEADKLNNYERFCSLIKWP